MGEIWVAMIISIGLAIDCFSVSLCIGSIPRPLTFRSIFRLSFHFGLFQGGMALLGWLLGTSLTQFVANIDHWIAFLLLLWVGGKMIREGISSIEEVMEEDYEDRTRGLSLIVLSVATSIDAFGVGLSLAFMEANIFTTSALIGFISLILSIIGLLGGRRIGQQFGKKAEIIGGLVLIVIGLRIVITHTLI
ncbi:MAG: manganese efflux pump [Anaerolineaceae bacterium]|nr:manganese efflux pump [Anaerolineaceae bacterium]